jgi:hypothetical protein
MRLLSAEGQGIARPNSTYGYDVIARIGFFRQEHRSTYDQIHASLKERVMISLSHVRYLYKQVYLPLLACCERQYDHYLAQTAKQHGGLIIALDGLAPEGGEPQLWFVRELMTGLTLRSGWLSKQNQETFEVFLSPLNELNVPILAVLSDKQKGLIPAVAVVLPGVAHQFCQAHYLRNLAEPLAESDSAFNVSLRKAVRKEVGKLITSESLNDASQDGLLTVTGLLTENQPVALEAESPTLEIDMDKDLTPGSRSAVVEPSANEVSVSDAYADEVVSDLLRHVRYLLTFKGRPPFRLAGIETYHRLQAIASFSTELLTYRHDPRLTRLAEGLKAALAPFANNYNILQQGEGWLQDIDDILEASEEPTTGDEVAKQLRVYLDDLLALPHLEPYLDDFRKHLDKVSTSYWDGLFHCYDTEGLPRTNNELESHFRDTQRRLLRTTGQKGQTRRILHRTGAWELLPRPSNETECLIAFRQVSPTEFTEEQQLFRQHQKRFRLHTRSTLHTNARLDQLRKQWMVLADTSTG